MDNNVSFISSIRTVSDFEELVRRFSQKIYSADAYLVGGPYDGGRDLVYSVRGREVRQALQISIQEKQIESKIEEDLEKVALLVSEHNYPPILNFFWSHTLSASKEDKIKTNARINFGITIEFYDANKIAQKLTNEYSDILKFLLEDIHNYKPSSNADIDIKQRAFYDYLVLSKDTALLKHVIVDSHVVSSLYIQQMKESELVASITSLGVLPGVVKSRLGHLKKMDRIEVVDDDVRLTKKEITRIDNVATKDQAKREEVLQSIKIIVARHTDKDVSEKILELIKEAYGASVDIQVTEENFEPPKVFIVKKAIEDIATLLKSSGGLSEEDSKAASHELVEAAAENEYLSNYCSTRLCIGLLNQSKLERYVENKSFFLYLDAPVLIRYMALMRYPDELIDGAFGTVRHLKESIRHLKTKEVRTTLEHFEETIRHLENAEKISRFANDELIQQLGDSKNIFFNLYLRIKKQSKSGFTFSDFLENFVGFESQSANSLVNFNALLTCARQFLEMGGIKLISNTKENDETFYEDIMRRFSRYSSVRRKRQTIKNDIIACQILGEVDNHLDSSGTLQTPMLITWDSTQQFLRKAFREKHPHDEWVVYMPQRAIERLSMIDLRIDSSDLKDSVLALIDEDFFKDAKNGSLVDTLALFLGENQTETGAVISLLTKLTRRITEESDDAKHDEIESYNTLNEILIYTQREFRSDFPKIRQIFSDERFTTELLTLLESIIKEDFGEKQKERYTDSLKQLMSVS